MKASGRKPNKTSSSKSGKSSKLSKHMPGKSSAGKSGPNKGHGSGSGHAAGKYVPGGKPPVRTTGKVSKAPAVKEGYDAKGCLRMVIKDKYASRYAEGYPLIFPQALLTPEILTKEGEVLRLYDEQGKFLATGYSGLQNKGFGWIVDKKEHTRLDRGFFRVLLSKALNLRQPYFHNRETTAFRVFNGEGDGFGGLIIDHYNGYYVINWYSNGVHAFRDDIIGALCDVAEVKGLYEKRRFDAAGKYIEGNDHVLGEVAPEPLIVKESGENFAVYLNDGAMVGVFLDQREVRKTIRDRYAKGKTVLNTFSYTGAFSVFAALGGASKTTSVDLANRSLSKTQEQFQVNGLNPDEQEILVEDVFNYFKYAAKKELSYDLVILDPPSFAKSKKFTFAAEKDYTALLKEAIAITTTGGVIVASTNCSTFNMAKFKSFVNTAFKESDSRYNLLEGFSLPSDFRTLPAFAEGDYLKVLFIRKLT